MKNLLWAALFLAGCGISQGTIHQGGDELGADSAELSSTSRTLVALRRDVRACASPACGGYFVHDVNRVSLSETYVSALDFSSSNLGTREQQQVLEAADGEVVLRGKLGPKDSHHIPSFIVSDAWRGMPGAAPAAGDLFYAAKSITLECLVAPCPTMQVKKANATATANFEQLDVSAVGHFINSSWLAGNALDGALVTGTIGTVADARGDTQLNVSQVFLPLPFGRSACPIAEPAACPGDKVRPWVRNADLCLSFQACITPGVCSFAVPSCGEGYQSVQYRGANGCSKVECDPSWISE